MLKLENVCAGYDGTEVLHSICFTFEKGNNYCVLGPNGCGKTTLVRAMARLIDSTGDIILNGKHIRTMKRAELARHTAVMSQVNSVYFPYTVYDTVQLGRYARLGHGLFGRAGAKDKEAVEASIRAVGLWELREKYIDTLSGGQRQRVFLAQALAQEPDIIMLDEPTNHLDIRHQLELIDFLKKWSADGQHMVIGVLHDINLALRLTDNVLFMQEGKLVRTGRFGEIADVRFLNTLYDTDIAQYMRESYERWGELQ